MNKRDYKELYNEILKLESMEECEKFFDDLCTITELDAMLQRIKAAKMLLEDKTVQEVTKETKISSATLARISKEKIADIDVDGKYGDGGYKDILEKKKQYKLWKFWVWLIIKPFSFSHEYYIVKKTITTGGILY